MNLANCPRCDRVFQRSSERKVCHACLMAEEEALAVIRSYVETHPGCLKSDLLQAIDLDEAILQRLLRDGRLAVLGEAAAGLSAGCRKCGAPMVSVGDFCKSCAEDLGRALQASALDVSAFGRTNGGDVGEVKSLALVKSFLRRHPGASALAVEKATGVASAAVLLFFGEGRLGDLGSATSGLRGR
jgi:hypothetical protein